MPAPTADFTELNRLATQHQGKVVARIIPEIVAYKALVCEWLDDPNNGFANVYIKQYGTEYIVQQTPGKLRRLIHELTHVAVNEVYDNNLLNGPPSNVHRPARILLAGGQNSGNLRQTEYMDQAALTTIKQNINRLGALLLSAPQINTEGGWLGGRIQYMTLNPGFEYDTTINEILIDMTLKGFPKPSSFFKKNEIARGNAFFTAVEGMARVAHEARLAAVGG